ncbi:MAG: hypothetical protein ABIS86_09035, partial [Streptosporangiaceae bacterium]
GSEAPPPGPGPAAPVAQPGFAAPFGPPPPGPTWPGAAAHGATHPQTAPPAPWSPPPPPPPHWPAPPRRSSRGPLLATAAVVVVVLAVGVGAFRLVGWSDSDTSAAPPSSFPGDGPATPPTPATPARTTPVRTAPAAPGGYFSDATSLPTAFTAKIGKPLKILQLVIYPEYAILQAEDPGKKGNVDRYMLRGNVGDPEPVQLAGDEKDRLDQHLLPVASVDFSLVPKMVKDARARLRYEGAEVSHIILDRGIPFFDDIVWRVYVSGPRDSGRVEYTTRGQVRKVYR